MVLYVPIHVNFTGLGARQRIAGIETQICLEEGTVRRHRSSQYRLCTWYVLSHFFFIRVVDYDNFWHFTALVVLH